MQIEKVSTGELVKTVSPLTLTTDPAQAFDTSEDAANTIAAELTISQGESFIGHVPKPHV